MSSMIIFLINLKLDVNFIENGFMQDNNQLKFTIINSLNSNELQNVSKGIENENAKRRLNLLFSSNLHFKIENNDYNLFLKNPC
ncbi:hypothetical protein GCM10022396_06840 [Flavivirga amylovorans]